MSLKIPKGDSDLSRLMFIANLALFIILAWVVFFTPITQQQDYETYETASDDYTIKCKPLAVSRADSSYFLKCRGVN